MFEHLRGDATRGDLQPLVPTVGLMPGCSSGGSSPGNVVEVARAGSVLIYAPVAAATNVEGQMSLEQVRALGFGP